MISSEDKELLKAEIFDQLSNTQPQILMIDNEMEIAPNIRNIIDDFVGTKVKLTKREDEILRMAIVLKWSIEAILVRIPNQTSEAQGRIVKAYVDGDWDIEQPLWAIQNEEELFLSEFTLEPNRNEKFCELCDSTIFFPTKEKADALNVFVNKTVKEVGYVKPEDILNAIADHQQEIDALEKEKSLLDPQIFSKAIEEINNKLSYLRDNQYRYKLQAAANGIEVPE